MTREGKQLIHLNITRAAGIVFRAVVLAKRERVVVGIKVVAGAQPRSDVDV